MISGHLNHLLLIVCRLLYHCIHRIAHSSGSAAASDLTVSRNSVTVYKNTFSIKKNKIE